MSKLPANTDFTGVIDSINSNGIRGWVEFPGSTPPRVLYSINDQLLGEVNYGRSRKPFNESYQSLMFDIAWGCFPENILITDIIVNIIDNDSSSRINFSKSVEKKIYGLTVADVLAPSPSGIFSGSESTRSAISKKPVCVITYANSSEAWFPYFYDHYYRRLDIKDIFVITTDSFGFEDFDLKGLFKLDDFSFDDRARARLASGIINGLHAYYEWVLACDVDEIITGNIDPEKFIWILKNSALGCIRTLGIDVIATKNDLNFDMSRAVSDQRTFGLLNPSLSKPHLSKMPIEYSPGFHSCNIKPHLWKDGPRLLTLHLKWACPAIRAQLLGVIERVEYSNKSIAEYAKNTLSDDYHPRAFDEVHKLINIDSEEVLNFDQKYTDSFYFDLVYGIWFRDGMAPPLLKLDIRHIF